MKALFLSLFLSAAAFAHRECSGALEITLQDVSVQDLPKVFDRHRVDEFVISLRPTAFEYVISIMPTSVFWEVLKEDDKHVRARFFRRED